MGQFRLGKAKRQRESFEPIAFGFHAHATKETGLWVQALTWTMEKASSLTQDDRSAIRRFLRDYHETNDTGSIVAVHKPLHLVLLSHQWARGQSPRLNLPASMGAVARTLQSLCERQRQGAKPGSSSNSPLRLNIPEPKRGAKQHIFYIPGVKK